MKIESGTGNGFYAGVDNENRLRTAAVTLPRQHYVSKVDQKNFQVIGEATPVNGTVNVLHIRNSTPDETFSVTYIRLANVDLTTTSAATEYFTIEGGYSYSSGGTATDPINTYMGSPSVSGGVFYEGDPTLTGTGLVLDKHYPDAETSEHSFTKDGSLVIPPGQTLTIRYTGTGVAGSVYARVSFYASKINSLNA